MCDQIRKNFVWTSCSLECRVEISLFSSKFSAESVVKFKKKDWDFRERLLVMSRTQVRRLLLDLFLSTLSVAVQLQGAVLEYNWTIDYLNWAPDCVDKLVIAINGGFPGPLINATEGDTVVVHIHNKLPTESVVIHWHGILQRGSPWADGTAFVSQCPIQPEDEFTYQFVVEHPGTFFYHGHHGMQRAAGFYGPFNVHPKPDAVVPFQYDEEYTLLLNDWYHKSIYDQQLGLVSKPFIWVGEPQSLLINGRGFYNCSLVPSSPTPVPNSGDCVKCNNSNPQCAPYTLVIETGKTYRLRIASVSSLAALNFILEGHNLTLVEVDGRYVEPVLMDNLDVYSGESFSVLLTANQDPSRNYWAAINVRGRNSTTKTGVAVLSYKPNNPAVLPTTPKPVGPAWNDFALSMAKAKLHVAHRDFNKPLPQRRTDRHLFLLNTQNMLNGFNKWAVNNVTFIPTRTPILAAYKFDIKEELSPAPSDDYPADYNIFNLSSNSNTSAAHGVYEFNLNDVVDVILQNANTLTLNNSEIHPWHLHGHEFWVLGYGDRKFDPSTDYAKLNYVNPPYRNTAPVFPWGWTVIRFVADNPGVWPFHCHIEPHFQMGMGVIFAEGVDRLPAMPTQTLGCGLTKKLIHV